MGILSGYKTYVLAGVTVIGAVAAYLVGSADLNSTIQLIVTALMGAFIRSGITTTAASK